MRANPELIGVGDLLRVKQWVGCPCPELKEKIDQTLRECLESLETQWMNNPRENSIARDARKASRKWHQEAIAGRVIDNQTVTFRDLLRVMRWVGRCPSLATKIYARLQGIAEGQQWAYAAMQECIDHGADPTS